MRSLKLPNWTLSPCSPVSTGHKYYVKNETTGLMTYFDICKVYDGVVNEISLIRKVETMESGKSRAGKIRYSDEKPDLLIDCLKYIEQHDTLPPSKEDWRNDLDDE